MNSDELVAAIKATIIAIGKARYYHAKSTDMRDDQAAEDLARNLAQSAELSRMLEDPDVEPT